MAQTPPINDVREGDSFRRKDHRGPFRGTAWLM